MNEHFQLPILRFYRRSGCHLCEEGRDVLQAVLEERAAAGHPVPAVREVDLDADAEADRRYGETIPVLALEGHVLPLATSARQIRAFLEQSLDRTLA